MKQITRTIETSESGMESLLGEVITIFSLNYIYTGKLEEIKDTCCLLSNPSIVYDTGSFDTKDWDDSQKLPNEMFIMFSCIESFGIVK